MGTPYPKMLEFVNKESNLYTGYQEELFKNPWGVNEGFKHLQEKLDELVPRWEWRSKDKNKNLEKFRQASNAAYDLFNNGLGNQPVQENLRLVC